MKIQRLKNEIEVKEKAGEYINTLLQKYKDQPILLMLSGGSAINILDFVNIKSLGKNVTMTVLDERYSKDPKVNNFAQFAETEFYQNVRDKMDVTFLDTRIRNGENLEDLTERLRNYIKRWISNKKDKDSKIIATLGIGEDGHTAGIMPYPENPELFKKLFENTKSWVIGYNAGKKNPYPFRVTVNLPFLREKVDHSIVYAVGDNKREALKRVLVKEGTLSENPARIIHEMKNVQIFTNL